MRRRAQLLAALALAALPLAAGADWKDALLGVLNGAQKSGAASALSQNDILSGLKEALAQGTTRAVSALGRTDGFWANAGVRIPLPDSVHRVESLARKLGQGAKVDQFHLTLNRAAEQAVPQAAALFGDAVRKMSVADARGILEGPKDAATQYFRRSAGPALRARMLPIVQSATQQVGVTAQYKKLMSSYGSLLQYGGLSSTDLDGFVTDKAMDGLFLTIAGEEARIRDDPAARTTDLLKKVFGAGSR